jgi:hypothetical protein
VSEPEYEGHHGRQVSSTQVLLLVSIWLYLHGIKNLALERGEEKRKKQFEIVSMKHLFSKPYHVPSSK